MRASFLRRALVTTIALSRQSVAVNTVRLYANIMYSWRVPKLWTETIEEHRRAVHDATLDTTARWSASTAWRR